MVNQKLILTFLVCIIGITLISCSKNSTTQPNDDEKFAENRIQPQEETIIDRVEEQVKECDMTLDSGLMKDFDVSMFKEGIQKNSEGITFLMNAFDSQGQNLPVEGSLAVTISTTKIFNKERVRGDYVIFSHIFPIKKSELKSDCSSKQLLIRYEAIEKNTNYQYVKEDDPGMATFEFSLTGSRFDKITKVYHPNEGEEDLLHR